AMHGVEDVGGEGSARHCCSFGLPAQTSAVPAGRHTFIYSPTSTIARKGALDTLKLGAICCRSGSTGARYGSASFPRAPARTCAVGKSVGARLSPTLADLFQCRCHPS